LGELDCVGHLILALQNHPNNAKVVKNACMALASFVEPDGKFCWCPPREEIPAGTDGVRED